jgi:hypothetical protein
MSMRWLQPLLFSAMTATAATAAIVALPETPARACGGFFCDNTQPVNQAAERIIFSRGPDGQVTAVIQIRYEGPAERFAWMLPVAGRPDIRVSSDLAFSRLQQATNPSYRLNTTVEGTCRAEQLADSAGFADTASSADSFSPPSADPDGVTVVDQGSVGPYDYVVISVDSGMSAPASVAVEWLQENGFDIDDAGAARIGPYLESGMNLLSFRLTKGNDAGAIRPVILGFGAGLASIPIRPTAVAAVDDMGVMVWVVGPHRAVPVNYAALELNEALINWFSPNATYNNVVTEAANQAGGQGFVTEMSGPAEPLREVILPASEISAWDQFRENLTVLRSPSALANLVNAFGGHDGFAETLSAHLVPPAGFTIDDILRCPTCVPLATDENGALVDFDAAAFLAAMESNVIDPMRHTSALFEGATVTRFYTTMSASEMTVDPSFDFNPDLPEVSASHVAERVIECSEAFFRSEAPWRVVLADGQVVRGFGQNWPFLLGTSDMPANARILRVGTSGRGEVIVDNTPTIADDVAANNADVQRRVAERTGGPNPVDGLESAGGACAGGELGGTSLLTLLGLLAARRRRVRA